LEQIQGTGPVVILVVLVHREALALWLNHFLVVVMIELEASKKESESHRSRQAKLLLTTE